MEKRGEDDAITEEIQKISNFKMIVDKKIMRNTKNQGYKKKAENIYMDKERIKCNKEIDKRSKKKAKKNVRMKTEEKKI